MSIIHVNREHHIGRDAARAEVERIAQRVRDEFGADYYWDGDVLNFSRSGISGWILVDDVSLDLTIKLGLLLSAIKGQIEHRIVTKIDEALASRDGSHPQADPEA
jgi:putative polyhydroxyalkanoate system protein